MTESDSDEIDECSRNFIYQAIRDLAGNANDADADQVAFDVRVEGDEVVIVVEDDGRGMTASHLERFFDSKDEEVPFYGANEVLITTTRDDKTLHGHSSAPPEYSISKRDTTEDTEGTRVEIRGVDEPPRVVEQLDERNIREEAGLDESDWSAIIQIDSPEAEEDRASRSRDRNQLRGAIIHDTLENELLEIVEVNTDEVIAVPDDGKGEERRIPRGGVQGLKGSRYVIKEEF